MVDEAFDQTGHVGVLICSAGILRGKMMFNISVEDWDIVQKVHLRGHFLPLHFAARRWRENAKKTGNATKASVILATSRSGLYASAGQLTYAAAKGGISAMAVVAARELSRYGVRTNAIAPMARTRMTGGSFGTIGSTRWDPSNVAPMVAFLARDESIGINGQVFIVGGGRVEWMRTWTPQGEIDTSGRPLTVDAIVSRRDQLFGGCSPEPADFPTATWD